MRGYFGLGQLSATEKQDILNQHKSLYNGYQTMQPQVSNTQPLYVYDFAGDKDGMVVNNKGEVKKYTNMGINEQVEEKSSCNECGGMMYEGECSECGWKGEMEEGVGHLDDIYNVNDLGDNDFDYVEGGGNDYGTFEKMHHMKKIKSEGEYEDPDNEDDGFEDIQAGEEMDEQGYTGGGNAPDMDISNVEPAYDFVSDGPGEVYPESEMDEDDCLDCDDKYETMESAWADDELDEQGWGTVARIAAPIVIDYAIDKLSNEEEMDENDVSGSQGIYGDMESAYDFDSEGPGKAGPYQHSEYNEGAAYVIGSDGEPRDMKRGEKFSAFSPEDFEDDSEDDFDEDELQIDFDKFDPRDKSWEEIKAHTGDWDEIDEDLQESFISQKNRVMEMMNRMKIIK